MTNKTLEQRITELEKWANRPNDQQIYGERNSSGYICGEINGKGLMAKEALEIIAELKSANKQKPCEYIYQGKGTSFCKLAASHGKELEEARRVIEELRAQLESKNELISNLINGE